MNTIKAALVLAILALTCGCSLFLSRPPELVKSFAIDNDGKTYLFVEFPNGVKAGSVVISDQKSADGEVRAVAVTELDDLTSAVKRSLKK